MKSNKRFGYFMAIVFLVLAVMPAQALSQLVEQVLSLAKKEKPVLLETLKDLVSIESGSRDNEGLDKLANLIAGRLKSLDGQVELVEPSNIYKMEDTPEKIGKMVQATFAGAGTKKILLIAHMDTVYPRGMLAQQPFRIEGDRAYGLGIADDKQGIAVILHTLAILKTMNFREYATLTVLINADEELSSPGSRRRCLSLGCWLGCRGSLRRPKDSCAQVLCCFANWVNDGAWRGRSTSCSCAP